MVWDLDGGSFFKLWMNVCSSIIGWKDYPFPTELPLHLCWKLTDPSLCGSLLERALIFTAQSGTEILCFWLQPFETPPHGFQTGPRLPPTPRHCLLLSPQDSPHGLLFYILQVLEPCPCGAWLQMNPQMSQSWMVPNRVFQEVSYTKARSPLWPIDPDAQGTLQPWPSWWAQSPLTSTHPSTPPPNLTSSYLQSGWRTFRRKIS